LNRTKNFLPYLFFDFFFDEEENACQEKDTGGNLCANNSCFAFGRIPQEKTVDKLCSKTIGVVA